MSSEIINYIDKLNKQTQEEYNGRFGIHIVNVRGSLVHINMTDGLLRVIQDDYAYWSNVVKGAYIWESFNRFVNKQLKEKR